MGFARAVFLSNAEEKKNALRSIARRANDEVKAQRRSSPALSCDEISRPILNGCMPLIKQLGLTPSHLYVEIGILNGYIKATSWQSAGWK
ncbi:hypothetical protein B4U25_46620 [Klebsiella pneumoniae]|nr:hypothetical protein B4U25_46620 [Klebsiella pneumoniae]